MWFAKTAHIRTYVRLCPPTANWQIIPDPTHSFPFVTVLLGITSTDEDYRITFHGEIKARTTIRYKLLNIYLFITFLKNMQLFKLLLGDLLNVICRLHLVREVY